MRTYLHSKIHRARVTGTNVDYEGSIAIDDKLLLKADIQEYEQVYVWNINNGERFMTYAIAGLPGEVSVNGAAARLVNKGDIIIVSTFQTDSLPIQGFLWPPKIIHVDKDNNPIDKEV